MDRDREHLYDEHEVTARRAYELFEAAPRRRGIESHPRFAERISHFRNRIVLGAIDPA